MLKAQSSFLTGLRFNTPWAQQLLPQELIMIGCTGMYPSRSSSSQRRPRSASEIPEVSLTSPFTPDVTHRFINLRVYLDEVSNARICDAAVRCRNQVLPDLFPRCPSWNRQRPRGRPSLGRRGLSTRRTRAARRRPTRPSRTRRECGLCQRGRLSGRNPPEHRPLPQSHGAFFRSLTMMNQ